MLSRVAESIYWMNRYIERAENVARFIDVNMYLTVGKNDRLSDQWQPLISTTGDDEEFCEAYDGVCSRENVLNFLLFDEGYANSVVSCVKRARENARRVRQVLPLVVWEQLNLFYHMVCQAADRRDLARIHEFCEEVRLASHLLGGAEDATSSKGEAWNFARLARMSERADKTSRIVDVQYFLLLPEQERIGSALDVLRWTALLQSTSALMMYRRQHGRIVPDRVAEFLILDPLFSRSMYHCVLAARNALENAMNSLADPGNAAQEATLRTAHGRGRATMQQLEQLADSMRRTKVKQIISGGLHEYVDDFQQQLNDVGESLSDEFFAWRAERDAVPMVAREQYQS